MLSLLLLLTWLPPVDGAVRRSFAGGDDPFARGLRRGVQLAAAAGEPVRAPCRGVVSFAGATPRGSAVTVLCGRRQVTLMPVRALVPRGRQIRRGARLGLASGDVRLSVREPDGAYVDPEPLLAAAPKTPPALHRPREPTRTAPPRRPAAPLPVPIPPLPWPAWAGAALVLGAGAARLRGPHRRRTPRLGPAAARRAP